MFLVPVVLLLLFGLAGVGRLKDKGVLWFSLAVLGSFLALTLTIHSDVYGSRYQLPFFVSWAPVFGFTIEKLGERRLATIAAFLLLLAALPWVFINTTRPLIAVSKKPEMFSVHPKAYLASTEISSILIAPPTTILFANAPYLRLSYLSLTKALNVSKCNNVGLYIDLHDIEYQFWWLLGAPQNGMHIETLYYADYLARYADASFKPCAVICTICADMDRLHGMNLAGKYPGVRLYLGGNYDPNNNN